MMKFCRTLLLKNAVYKWPLCLSVSILSKRLKRSMKILDVFINVRNQHLGNDARYAVAYLEGAS